MTLNRWIAILIAFVVMALPMSSLADHHAADENAEEAGEGESEEASGDGDDEGSEDDDSDESDD